VGILEFPISSFKFRSSPPQQKPSAVSEILRISVGVAEIVIDQHGRLPGQLKALATFVAGDQVIQPHHERSGFGKFSAVFFSRPARQFPLFARNFPAHRKLKFSAAARAHQLDLSRFFFFRVKRALVHS
jgi:hypothetical protein